MRFAAILLLMSGCATLEDLPSRTRPVEGVEFHVRDPAMVQRESNRNAAEAIRGVRHSWDDPLGEVKSGWLAFDGSASGVVSAVRSRYTLHLHLSLLKHLRRSTRTREEWLATPTWNVDSVRQRIRYVNDDAVAMFMGGLFVGTISAGAFVAGRAYPPGATAYNVLGSVILGIGAIMAGVGGAYGFRPDDVKTIWSAPQP